VARVAVILKVLPNDVSIEPSQLLEKIKEALPSEYEIMSSGEEPIAFGLKALKVIIAMPEETEGGTEELESLLKSIEGVEEVEIEAVHRMS